MTALLDPSVILAAADRSDLNHDAAVAWFRRVTEPLAISSLALTEADHLLERALGSAASDAFLEAIDSGAIEVLSPSRADLAGARALRAEVSDTRVSLSDAVTVALAVRLGARRVGTLYRRPYSLLRSVAGGDFDIEP